MGRAKIIRNWKVVNSDLDFITAYNLYKAHDANGVNVPVIGMRLGYTQFFQSGLHNIEGAMLLPKEITSNKWEIIIPDDDAEEKTNKLRQMFKNNNFSGLRYEKIDNMSIEELWNSLFEVMDNLDKNNKYRIAKHIIENGIYKKV